MKTITETVICIESKIVNPDHIILSTCGTIQQSLSRKLFNQLLHNKNLKFKDLQRTYIANHNIHARLFKSIYIDITGKIQSLSSNNKNYIVYLQNKIKKYKEKIKKSNDKHYIYYLNNKIQEFKNKLNNIEIHCTWGSQKLYKSQWTKYKDNHQTWRKEWNRKRNHKIFIIGSSDESHGNSLCQLTNLTDLRLTLPKSFDKKHLNCQVNFDRNDNAYLKKAIENQQALTYTIFQRENNDWYVTIAFTIQSEITKQKKDLGIDVNYNLITTTRIKQDGNPENFSNYRFNLENKTSNQNKQTLIDIVHKVTKEAKDNNSNLVIEDLKLLQKRNCNTKSNRKLHMIAYKKFFDLLISCAMKIGVLIKQVNPAYTSIIGKHKYSKKLGIGVHSAASYVIARRGQYREIEQVPSELASLLHGGEKNKHHWTQWNLLDKRLRQFRMDTYGCIRQ